MTWDPNDPLKPTGDCYADCARLLTGIGSAYAGWELVHGRPTLTRPPHIQYGHAWLLRDGIVRDPAGVTLPEGLYLKVGKIDTQAEYYVYTAEAARRMIVKYEHWGPWEGIEAEGLV